MTVWLRNLKDRAQWRRESFREYMIICSICPVCQGTMRGEFGYQANTLAGRQVLSGNYKFTEGFHEATRELMEECARVRTMINARSVNTNMKWQGW